jgi:5-methyltetrahydropteroyltriglutamate--homocysteine methyltransferase
MDASLTIMEVNDMALDGKEVDPNGSRSRATTGSVCSSEPALAVLSSDDEYSGEKSPYEGSPAGLATTVIGSFPKPDYLGICDWFKTGVSSGGASDATAQYTEMLSRQTEEQAAQHEKDVLRATKEVIDFQEQAGVSVVTDGEIRRENYIHYLCRFMNGIDFINLTETSCRGGAYIVDLPTINGKVTWRGPLDCADEWRKAQDLSTVPVKYTIPGPMTIMGTLSNQHYEDEQELAADLAVIVNMQILRLVEAGCRHIQVDEPVFCRQPEKALKWGVQMLDRCFDSVDGSVCRREVHMCCGYPDHLDQEGYLKADKDAYFQLAPAIDACCVDAVSIEDAHRPNDLKLLELFRQTTVILGVLKVASSKVESSEEIEARLNEALQHIDADRLIVAPDCGLGLLPPKLIQEKLRNMCTAAWRVGCSCKSPACV